MTNKLKPLGLAENDSLVYEHLLRRGHAMATSKIASALGLHRQYVHTSLLKLVGANLVERLTEGARPKFIALPPRYVTQRARMQYEEAERVAKTLETISNLSADQEFDIYRGRQQIVDGETNFVHDLPFDTTQYIIGGGAKAYFDFWGDQYDDVTKVAHKRGLKTMYVGCVAELQYLKKAQAVLREFEYRLLPDLPQTIVQTAIRLDSVTLYSFGNPPLVYTLKSKTVFEDYKKFFFLLWNKATPQ